MVVDSSHEELIARLESRVATLEALLEQRSRELRLIQQYVCHRDLIVISRVLAGFQVMPFGPFDPDFWAETTDLTTADVGETLETLWRAVRPVPPGEPGDA